MAHRRSPPPRSRSIHPKVSAALLASLSLAGCSSSPGGQAPPPPEPEPVIEAPARPAAAEDAGAPAADTTPPPPVAPRPDPRSWAERTLATLDLHGKVGQMMMPFIYGDFAPEGSSSARRVDDFLAYGVGGVIMSVGTPMEVAAKLNDMQRRSRVPLLVGADLETGAGFRLRGAVHMPASIELGGATDFPPLMAVGATGDADLAWEMGRITAIEARAVGIHVPFAPVLDVNNNPANPVINTRSFGQDPALVSAMGAAFVQGMQAEGAIATGKHFPGHGDTGVDSHLALPTIPVSRARMDTVELRPFQAAIDAGMGAVMTAHITIPALTPGNGEPATLAPEVLTGLLREQMGFRGLLVTDAMDMRAISGRLGTGEAAVRAVAAGADVILMPPSVAAAMNGIVDAVRSGRIPESRIDDAVLRILRAKEALGLGEEPTVAIEDVPSKVGIPAHQRVAEEIAQKSITVIRNGGGLLPLRGTRTARVMSVTYRRQNDILAGRYFERRLRRTYPRLSTVDTDRTTPASTWSALARRARGMSLVVVGAYVSAVGSDRSRALPDELSDFVGSLAEAGVPHVVVSFGNPYLISEVEDARAYVLAWSGSEVSQWAAAGALFGDFPVTGRSPIAFRPWFELGEGIRIPYDRALGGG